MNTACPTCGGRTEGVGSAGGLCVRCAGMRVLAQEVGAGGGSQAGGFDSAPRRIGPYELIEELGRGGMGRVFLARQDGLDRIVALKVLPDNAALSAEAEVRFQREARTIARLHHPHIVAIYDLGRADGFLYFSMEYIPGGDLARRLREQPFGPHPAAALLRPIAAALAYAHREGVLHRDLKPSNILLDGEQPRLADFGLATEVEPGADLTRTLVLLGTPHYLAPEALRAGSQALTAASDIYAFGVVLFELLTGRTPYAGAAPSEMPALVAHTDPPAPSMLAPAVPKDLETICLKCLEKDPSARYGTADDVADDLGRYLAGQPIRARRPSTWQRAARFARRHRVGVAAGVAIAAILVVATAVSSALAVRATRAERQAKTAARASEEISDFFRNDVLAQASPDQQPDRDLKLRTVLDNAAHRIEGRFPDEPLVEADLRDTLGQTYATLGLYAEAMPYLRRVLELRRRALPADDPATLGVLSELAVCSAETGDLKTAEAMQREVIASARRTQGPAGVLTLNTMNDLIFTYKAEGRLADAEATGVATLAAARAHLSPDDYETRIAMQNLSSIYFSEDRLADAEKLNLEAYQADLRVQGAQSPVTLVALSNLASVYWAEGKLKESETVDLRLLDTRRRVLGNEHPDTLRTMHNLATTYYNEGEYAEAEKWERQDYEGRRRILAPDHLDLLSAQMALAMDELELGHDRQATDLGERTIASLRRVAGTSHFLTRAAMGGWGEILTRTGRLADAEADERELWQCCRRDIGPSARQTLTAEVALAGLLQRESRSAEAEPLAREAWQLGQSHAPTSWRTLDAQSQLGVIVAALGRAREGESLALAAYSGLLKQAPTLSGRDRRAVREAGERLVDLYTVTHQLKQAADWRLKLAAQDHSS